MKALVLYSSYKTYLKDLIQSQSTRGLVGQLAKAAGCDRTYLSQSLNSKVQLTPDHAAGISGFLGLNPDEQDYFLHLVLFERAGSKEAKLYFEKKLKTLSDKQVRISEAIGKKGTPSISEETQGIYYSDPIFSMVHILTAIKETQAADAIAKLMKKPLEQILGVLNTLVSMGLVDRKGALFVHSGKSIHLKRGTAYNKINHLHWRLKAVENSNNEKAIHYSTLSAISVKDWPKLKHQLMDFIQNQQSEIEKSDSEMTMVFCCDLFSPTES